MTVVAAILSLALGLAYTGLGVITAIELWRHSGSRGFSFFGAAFLLMAATCGPHHLMHAIHLFGGERASTPLVTSLLLGTPAGVVFILLRVEAAFGGRGDRLIAGTPLWLATTPWVALAVAGGTLFEGFEYAADHGFELAGFAPNLVLFANYGLVGIFTVRTQFARRPVLGGWSLVGRLDGRRVQHLRAHAHDRRPHDGAERPHAGARQPRRPGVDLLPLRGAPPAPLLAARLEPHAARRPRRPAGSAQPVGRR